MYIYISQFSLWCVKEQRHCRWVFVYTCTCVYVLEQNVALWMGHSGKEAPQNFFSSSLYSRKKNVKLLDSAHPNKIPLSTWNFSSKSATHEIWVNLGKESYFMFLSWVFLIIIACVFPFTLSLVRHPSLLP